MSFILGKRQDSLRKDEKKVLKPVISINILDLGVSLRVDISNQLVVGASHSHFNSIYPGQGKVLKKVKDARNRLQSIWNHSLTRGSFESTLSFLKLQLLFSPP